jgi:hypothetical protein
MTRIGKCCLCLNDPVKMCRSHFFPAAAYRVMREHTIREGQFKNSDPIRLTDRFAKQTSEQYTAHLLCRSCEQRFHANGENWVLKYCWRGTEFRLANLVTNGKAVLTSPELSAYHANEIQDVDVSALTYFSASMFWRAAVHNWSRRVKEPAIDLGPYTEELRKYLSGSTMEFPQDCILLVTLPNRDCDQAGWMMHPFPKRTHGCHMYAMCFLGIGLSLAVGRQIPTDWRECDFVRGPGNPIIMSSQFGEMFERDFHFMFWDKIRAMSMLNAIINR